MNKQLTIAFHVYNFSFRGTEVALYDYADKNETILKNKSFIVCPNKLSEINNHDVIMKFSNRFRIFKYKNYDELKYILKSEKVNAMYIIKSGDKDELTNSIENYIPLLIHCVYKVNDPHGLIYAGISEEVIKNSKFDFVPHMITPLEKKNNEFTLPDHRNILRENDGTNNLRKCKNIPKEAIVFGRYGGKDTFFLPKIDEVLLKVVNNNSNIYFIFMPAPYVLEKIKHPQIIFHEPPRIDNFDKRKFIETCDAMIHCQILGESFGLSVLEFSSLNKPVITWNGGVMKQHLLNLKDRAILYNTSEELYNLLVNFKKENYNKGENYWNMALPKFNDINVMEKFENVFLKSLY
jgi:hypothetical protein